MLDKIVSKLNFEFSHNSLPNTFWFNYGKLENRQKHKLYNIDGFKFNKDDTEKKIYSIVEIKFILRNINDKKFYIKKYLH